MKEFQEKAWECLTPQEQNSLFLTLSQGKSTWETGEILKMTHYKYLELKARSEKFFKLFSDYFEKYPSLINPQSPLDRYFQDYLYASLIKRLPKDEAAVYAGESAWLLKPVKSGQIIRNMDRLKESSKHSEWDRDLYALILEFDRWNNYRILPKSLQAPTPYKTRSNKKYKAYMKYLHTLPDSKIKNLVDYFWCRTTKKDLDNRYYVAFVSSIYKEGYQIVPISKKQEKLNELTRFKIYVFPDRVNAEEFGLMVATYFTEITNQKRGLKFWREFREVIENAVNYREINNMDFTVYSLDTAYSLKRKPVSAYKRASK